MVLTNESLLGITGTLALFIGFFMALMGLSDNDMELIAAGGVLTVGGALLRLESAVRAARR